MNWFVKPDWGLSKLFNDVLSMFHIGQGRGIREEFVTLHLERRIHWVVLYYAYGWACIYVSVVNYYTDSRSVWHFLWSQGENQITRCRSTANCTMYQLTWYFIPLCLRTIFTNHILNMDIDLRYNQNYLSSIF